MAGKKGRSTTRASAGHKLREPLVDIFEEENYLLVEAELPGIGERDVRIEFKNDVLTVSAQHGERRFRKEVLLPRDISLKQMQMSCKNGILRIKCLK